MSRKMHWKSSSECAAMILCRVVCALLVTMDSFCRMMALSSVLFPALGFPTMATYPACMEGMRRIILETLIP